MTDTYKVRMTVLAMIASGDDHEAKDTAMELAESAGLTVLHVEEPDKITKLATWGSLEGDIYP